MIQKFGSSKGSVVTILMGTVAMVGVVSVAAMNMIGGPITTASKVTHQNMAQNDLLMNAKVVVMNASTRLNMGDEDGDGYVEPVPFVPTSAASCNITLPAEGGCLPADIGAILTDPWGTQYAYCVWDHGDPRSSTNRIDGENSTSGAVLAIISAGPNKRFETPCLPYDGNPDTNDEAINPQGIGDDLVQIYTYAAAVAGSGGLWELKQNEPETAVIDKKLEIGDVDAGTGFAFDTTTGEGEFPYIKTDFLASKSGGSTPVTMVNNIALDGNWLSGDGTNEGIAISPSGETTIVSSSSGRALKIVVPGDPYSPQYMNYISSYFGNNANDLLWYLGDGSNSGRVLLTARGPADNYYPLDFEVGMGLRMRITPAGNIGIGTSTPDHHLSVADNSDDPTVISLENNNATGSKARSVLFLRGNGDASSHSGGLMYANTSFTLGTNYEALRPQGLSLYTNPSASGGISIASASPTGVFTINTGGLGQSTERLRITANGNVGIGTTTPATKLEVTGSVVTGLHGIYSATAPAGKRFWAQGMNSATGHFYIGYRNDEDKNPASLHAVPFWIQHGAPDNALYVRENGNIGIGTTAATQKLQVNGLIDVTNNRILRVATPSATTDAANKAYVDSLGGKTCSNGQVLKWNGTTWACSGDNIGMPSSPGGSNGQVQFNSGGSFAGNSGFTYNGAGGVAVTSSSFALTSTTSGTNSSGITGMATATTGTNVGVSGHTSSTAGSGVKGIAFATSGTNYGVHGATNSASGYGVSSQGRMHSTGALTVGSSVTATSFSGNGSGLTNLNGSNLSSGTVPVARIGTGTKNTTTFLRGDGTFAVPPSGADNLGNHTATANLNMSNRAITADVGTIRDASGGWVRTYGATGWYSQTYGGGWYMTDTTWIRAYSNKSVVTGGNMQAAAFLYGSDERLKADIRPLGLTLDDLEGIHAYRYRYKADKDQTPHIGVIAQEVQSVFPEAVKTGEDGMMSVDYPALVPVLLDAVKQLKAENDAIRRQMKADNDNLRMEIRALTKGAR